VEWWRAHAPHQDAALLEARSSAQGSLRQGLSARCRAPAARRIWAGLATNVAAAAEHAADRSRGFGDRGHSQPTRLKYQWSTTTVMAMMAIASG
jgi:hypothetical protein